MASEAATYEVAGVVAPHRAAAEAARDILIEGGNAIEAAVAAAIVAGLVLPHLSGLGGDGAWMIREAGSRGRLRMIDARGPAGGGATIRHFRDLGHDALPRHGLQAASTVPGAVAGWRAALDLSQALGGRLPLARLFEPALALVRAGVPAAAAERDALALMPAELAAAPGFAAAFLDDGQPPAEGFTRHWPALAGTLAYLAQAGLDDVYRGDVAREIAAELEAHPHILGRDDLRRHEARWRAPAELGLSKAQVAAPASRAGLALLFALGLFDRLNLRRPEGFDPIHSLIEALAAGQRRVAAAAATDAPLGHPLDAAALDRAVARLDRARAGAPPVLGTFAEAGLWIGVIDGAGLAVSLTQSLGSAFGSGVVLKRTGLLLGNRGAGFSLEAARGPVLAPGRRPPLQALPVIASRDDGGLALFGAGQEGAVPAAQVWARLRLGVGTAAAIEAPRFSWVMDQPGRPAVLHLEEECDSAVVAALHRAGHPLEQGSRATAAGLLRRLPGGRIEAAPDFREAAAAAGF